MSNEEKFKRVQEQRQAGERRLAKLRARWFRVANAIVKLERKQKRLGDRATKLRIAASQWTPQEVKALASDKPPIEHNDPGLDIPEALRRADAKPGDSLAVTIDVDAVAKALNEGRKKDEAAKAEILAAQEEKKKVKAKASAAKSKAKYAGDLRRMPLSGKAALAKIESTK